MTAIKSPSFMEGIENKLKDIIEKRYGCLITDRAANLDIDTITNLEILMDLEECLPSLLQVDVESIDNEFKKCESYNDMLKCVYKYMQGI